MPTWSELPGWGDFKQVMVDGGAEPAGLLALAGGRPLPEPATHGRFLTDRDLPQLEGDEADRLEPAWDAIWALLGEHPEGCGCDRTVMVWRACYAAGLALLRSSGLEGAEDAA